MPVKLEPGKTYVLGINSERFRNFKDIDGHPALPYLLVFHTKAAKLVAGASPTMMIFKRSPSLVHFRRVWPRAGP